MSSTSLKNGHARNWAELPTEILGLICTRIGNLLDHIHFRKVCRLWRCAAKSVCCLPSLLLPYQEESTIKSFLPYPYTKILQVDLPGTHNKRFYSTSQGWFLLLGLDPDIILLNPITGSQYCLPPLSTIDVVKSFDASCADEEYCISSDGPVEEITLKRSRRFMRDYFIRKTVLSSFSSNVSHQVLMISVHYSPHKLYLCRPGDKQWSSLRPETLEDVIVDFTYSMGYFFVMDFGGRVTTVPCCFDRTSPSSLHIVVPCLNKEIHFGCSLVGSEDGLFLTRKYSNYDENGCNSEGFVVFKLDTTSSQQPQWSIIESMNNAAFYFSGWNWVSFPTGNSPLCKGSNIYYPYVSGLVDYRQRNFVGYDIGVYNIEDGSFVRLMFDWRGEFNAINAAWFKPTLD